MPDEHMRLVHYKRIANARSNAELDELQVELIDRFGLLPPPLKTLFAITSLKLLKLIEGEPKRYRLDGPFRLRFGWQVELPDQRLPAIKKLLRRLAPAIPDKGDGWRKRLWILGSYVTSVKQPAPDFR